MAQVSQVSKRKAVDSRLEACRRHHIHLASKCQTAKSTQGESKTLGKNRSSIAQRTGGFVTVRAESPVMDSPPDLGMG